MPKLLILFVHGLGGSSDSWGRFGELINGDSELAPFVTCDFYNFPTGIIRFLDRWRSLELQDLADGLSTYIDNRYAAATSILLVAHSMGGLLCKEYIARKAR